MKKIILMVMVTLFMVGCTTGSRYKMAEQNGKWYATDNETCPKVEFHKDDSITCYSNDMVKLKTVQPTSEAEVRAYRDNLEKTRAHNRNVREAERAFNRVNLNSNLGHL